MSVLILCEKPSAARNFAKALGGKKGSYDGTQYEIVNLVGHCYEFVSPSDMVPPDKKEQYGSWDLSKLPWDESIFNWKHQTKKNVGDILKTVKNTAKSHDTIAIATDYDMSGEGFLLAFEAIYNLGLLNKKIERIYFYDEAPKSIQDGFKQRKKVPDVYKNEEYLKAWLRTRWDFLSMQFTRIATKASGSPVVVRQGRLKSAMVYLVGKQLEAYNDYKKIPFYENRFRDENGVVYSDPDIDRFEKKEDVPGGLHPSAVVCDGKAMKKTAPPKLLDLSALSAMLAPKGFKPKQILDTYQKMYEDQIVSYPRTEDSTITPEQFNELLPKIDAIADVVGADKSKLTHRVARKTHVKVGGAHGANRPGLVVPKSLDSLDKYGPGAKEIYSTLAKSYLSMLAEDYEYEQQKGHVKDYPTFKGSVNVPKKLGWKAVFSTGDDDVDDENAKGLGTMADPFIHEGFPPRPAKPTIKWLMKQLERAADGVGIGTGATRTSTIAEITTGKAALLNEKRGNLTMTDVGDISYGILPGTKIGDLMITKQVTDQMEAVAKGEADADDILHGVQELVKHDLGQMQLNADNLRKAGKLTTAAAVPYASGNWNGKDIKFKRVWSGHEFTDKEVADLLAGKTITIDGCKGKSGNVFAAKGKLEVQEFKGRKFVGFKLDGFADSSHLPASFCQHKFTAKETKALESGKKIKVDGLFSKKTGKTFSANLEWVDDLDQKGRKKLNMTFD